MKWREFNNMNIFQKFLKKKHKEAYIHAFMAGNLGDDLFVRMLCNRYPDISFDLCAGNDYIERFKDLKNCKIYPESEREHLVEKADLSIHIGGCCFVQHFDDWTSFYDADKFFVDHSKKHYFLGGNFGPFTDDRYYEAYKDLFPKYKGICFRDRYSWELFKENSNITYAPDIVFGYKANQKEKRKKVLFSPISFEGRGGKYSIEQYGNSYFKFHENIIRKFISKGYEICLVSFCANQNDELFIESLYDKFDEDERKYISKVYYRNNIYDVIREFEDSEIVIATRFHSMILGFIHNCKVLPIIYDQKTGKVLDDLKYDLFLELKDLETVDISKEIQNVIERQPIDTTELSKEANKQFQFLDQELKI